jgi:hypothetical protein
MSGHEGGFRVWKAAYCIGFRGDYWLMQNTNWIQMDSGKPTTAPVLEQIYEFAAEAAVNSASGCNLIVEGILSAS